MKLTTGFLLVGSTLVMSGLSSVPATAQTIDLPAVRINDTSCSEPGSPNIVPPCVVDGTRTVVGQNVTITATPSTTFDLASGTYQVTFDGTATGRELGSIIGGSAINGVIEVEADWQANYTGRLINLLVPDGTPPDFVPALFQQYPQIDGTFSSLDLSIETGQIVNSTGTYDFTLGTPNPTQLGAGNTVALGGEYHLSDERFGTSYGTVTGQASIVRFLGAGAPYQVVSSITAVTETTHLDASGLVTPQVAVTDGIDMGGSNLTNLAAGVAPTDAVNVAQLDQESTARQAADAALQGNIDAEATNRAQADVQLVQRIAAEEASRQSADVVLQEGIAAEAMTRAQADLQLNQRVGAAESGQANLAVALSNEVNARMAADLAAANMIAGFGNQLNTLSAQVDALASRVDAFEDNVASSTAVAVALGGNAFLPDTRFNLTANVGTYGGAHAGSFQLGALVSRNVAINAGVATGFNRGGKTGGRVGMTLGW